MCDSFHDIRFQHVTENVLFLGKYVWVFYGNGIAVR